MRYMIKKEEFEENGRIVFPYNFISLLKYSLGRAWNAPSAEKWKGLLETFDTLLALRTYKEGDKHFNVLMDYYEERYTLLMKRISKLKEDVAILESYLCGISDETILWSDIKNKRYFEFRKASQRIALFNHSFMRAFILLIKDTNLQNDVMMSQHFTVGSSTVREMRLISKDKRSSEAGKHLTSDRFDDDGSVKDQEYFNQYFDK